MAYCAAVLLRSRCGCTSPDARLLWLLLLLLLLLLCGATAAAAPVTMVCLLAKAGCATVARVLPTAARAPCNNPESGGLLRYHACGVPRLRPSKRMLLLRVDILVISILILLAPP